jgi:hypothetical protein
MAVAITITDRWYDSKREFVVATVVLSGSYVSGGDTLNLSTISTNSSLLPLQADITSQASTAAQALNAYLYVPGTNQTNCKIRCFIGSAAELAAGAYPAAATGDVIQLQLCFKLR